MCSLSLPLFHFVQPQITTLDQLKSPTPLSVEQKPDVADLKPSIDTPERQPSLTSPPSTQSQPQPQPQQQLDPPSNTPLTKPSPPSLPQPPSLTSPPLKTPGESSQQVQVATASTPAEPPLSAKIVPNPQLKKGAYVRTVETGNYTCTLVCTYVCTYLHMYVCTYICLWDPYVVVGHLCPRPTYGTPV